MDPAGPVARRFPLVPRPRPACSSLAARVERICDLARTAARSSDLATASAACNQAALVASDCGLPDLARQWCQRHAFAYLRARPLDARAARYALEPLVNLARLHIRDGNGDTAFHLLDTLYEAITSRTDTAIDGILLPASDLTRSSEDHRDLRRWLWTVHLSDSPRALISAGRWQDALAHLQRHHGIGQRMLDGRQVAVIAQSTAGNTDGALKLLEETAPGEPWEQAVTACLTVLCRPPGRPPAGQDLTAMLDAYRQFNPLPQLAVFCTTPRPVRHRRRRRRGTPPRARHRALADQSGGRVPRRIRRSRGSGTQRLHSDTHGRPGTRTRQDPGPLRTRTSEATRRTGGRPFGRARHQRKGHLARIDRTRKRVA